MDQRKLLLQTTTRIQQQTPQVWSSKVLDLYPYFLLIQNFHLGMLCSKGVHKAQNYCCRLMDRLVYQGGHLWVSYLTAGCWRLRELRNVKPEKLSGIWPESSLQDKSRDSRAFRLPISFAMPPERLFLDKFSNWSPFRFANSVGISPDRRLLDKSIPVI